MNFKYDVIIKTRDQTPRTLKVKSGSLMIDETRVAKQTSLVKPGTQELWSKCLIINQIPYKLDLSNKFFDLQSYHKTTLAYLINKVFLLQQVWFVYTQVIYTLSQKTSAQICILYFNVKPIFRLYSLGLFLCKTYIFKVLAFTSTEEK